MLPPASTLQENMGEMWGERSWEERTISLERFRLPHHKLGNKAISLTPASTQLQIADCTKMGVGSAGLTYMVRVSVSLGPRPKPTPARIASSTRMILEAIRGGVGLGLGPRLGSG